QVLANVQVAQERQTKEYARRQTKGVKVFDFKVDDMVLRRNMKNVGRKGGKLESQWIGPY
ncbi:hypothetical protein LSAT2_030252, partial [Lamellibrachia satsuma]